MRGHGSTLVVVAITMSLVVTGCGGSTPSEVPGTATSSRTLEPSPSAEASAGSPVRFAAADGVRISGRLVGEGRVGVVLGHQIDGDQRDWWDFARTLADEGHAALAINFRGYCPEGGAGCSGDGGTGDTWRDLAQAPSGSAAAAREGWS